MINIYSYNGGSRGAKQLATALGVKRIRHTGSRFKGSPAKTVINWGATELSPEVAKCHILNPPAVVRVASNKLDFFNHIDQVCRHENRDSYLVPHTHDRSIAEAWLKEGPVVCRTVLRGHSGNGIVIATDVDELVTAPLYTKYMKKKEEYRIHMGRNGVLIDAQRKARRNDHENPDWKVRNHANGFVYTRGNFVPNDHLLAVTSQTISDIGLDFGAVDVIWNAYRDQYFVLEVNTAPGLEGQTIENYANFFKGI